MDLPNDIRLVAGTPKQTHVLFDGVSVPFKNIEIKITVTMPSGMYHVFTTDWFVGDIALTPHWVSAKSVQP